MNVYQPAVIAGAAVARDPARPATVLTHDHDDGRLVVFRLEPGQEMPRHTSTSSVFLTVIAGGGFVADAEDELPVGPGDMIAFAPDEPHGMRAAGEQLVLAALITPRPGSR